MWISLSGLDGGTVFKFFLPEGNNRIAFPQALHHLNLRTRSDAETEWPQMDGRVFDHEDTWIAI
jgi:hypothetical protein